MKKFIKITIKGIVQGVGFRPFIYRIAYENDITGNVRNDTEGVAITASGEEKKIESFLSDIRKKQPPLSLIEDITSEEIPEFSADNFSIEKSGISDRRNSSIAPDAAVCEECMAEFHDSKNRRYHYPFITCTNCGPRFSIVTDIPYDRQNTTMSSFNMCGNCSTEYSEPLNRRFHTQPNACPVCGPQLFLYKNDRTLVSKDAEFIAQETLRLLLEGNIIAIKGVGGYLLAADAFQDKAVKRLRDLKGRPFKPFAIMAGSIVKIKELAHVSKTEKTILLSKERPIILLKARRNKLSKLVAPSLSYIGVMLPYTPFQHHLFSLKDLVLIMTSGNIADEPIIFKDEDAFGSLSGIADYFVSYNRKITGQTDDSVIFVEKEEPYFIRRSRGHVPVPFKSSNTDRQLLALGGDLKNCFGLAREEAILLSQHIGDLGSLSGNHLFRNTIEKFKKIYDIKPDLIISDLHPGYFTTQYADELEESGIERISVQHHHSHIAGVLEENGLNEKIIGIAYDGTGYGSDGKLWGSEFLIANKKDFVRAGHFSYFPLPGGESAIKDVWKIGLSLLYKTFGPDFPVIKKSPETESAIEIIQKNINSPLTCSIGRLFDGVSAILGLSSIISTEAEAAMLLEEAAHSCNTDSHYKPPDIQVKETDGQFVISTEEIVEHIVSLIKEHDTDYIAFAFHNIINSVTVKAAELLRDKFSINKVGLSGGVFQNRLLLNLLADELKDKKFEVFVHHKVPANDGCIALGQIAIGKERFKS